MKTETKVNLSIIIIIIAMTATALVAYIDPMSMFIAIPMLIFLIAFLNGAVIKNE